MQSTPEDSGIQIAYNKPIQFMMENTGASQIPTMHCDIMAYLGWLAHPIRPCVFYCILTIVNSAFRHTRNVGARKLA